MNCNASPISIISNPLVKNLYIEECDSVIIAPGAPRFLITEDGRYLITEDGRFIVTEN